MPNTKKVKGSELSGKLEDILRRLDVLVIVQLANAGLTLKEIAKILDTSEDTIERMLPIRKVKAKRQKK